jgi:putative cell wall-binding protein
MSGRTAALALGDRLPDVAEVHGMTAEELREHLRTDPHLKVDRRERLFYADPAPESLAELAHGAEPSPAEPAAGEPPMAEAIPPADAFTLHSRPGAQRTIYIDFDGHVLTGTAWNDWRGYETIVCPPWDTEGGPDVFTDAERAKIIEVWQRVAEDYAPYDVDVTTEYTGEDVITRSSTTDEVFGMRALVSPAASYFSNYYSGLAYVGVFDMVGDYYKPALIFPERLANTARYVAEAVSHEVGHTLGLGHDGSATSSYYSGHGSGETGWGPIMGTAYYKNLSQWSQGEYAGADNQQDDLALIVENGLPYRTDDHGGALGSATTLGAGPSVTADGVISTRGDADLFSFECDAGPVSFDVSPVAVGPNLDVEAKLLDASGATIASDNPTELIAASVGAAVPAGTYYLRVDGVGKGDPLTAYSDYGSLGAYSIAGSFTPADGDPPPPDNVAPTAVIDAAPVTGVAPLTVSLDGSGSSDPDGSIVAYEWDLGDGATSAAAGLEHTYDEPGAYVVELVVTDDDGASGAASVNVVVYEPEPTDTTAPVTTSDAEPSYADEALVTLSASDEGGSGVIATYYILDGGAQWPYAAPIRVTELGGHTLEFWSVDNAGNVEDVQTVTFEVVDTIAPSTSSDAAASYENEAVVSLSAHDNPTGSGVAATYYSLDGAGARAYAGGIRVNEAGTHTLRYWSVDVAGNAEAMQTVGFEILDTIDPTTEDDAEPFYVGSATITLSAEDNPGGSGVAATYCALDGGTAEPYAGPIAVFESGSHTLEFWSTDHAGNTESHRFIGFEVIPLETPDTQAPQTSCDITLSFGGGVLATLSAVDAGGSGVAATYYELDGGATRPYEGPVEITGSGTHTLEFWSVDGAGNEELPHNTVVVTIGTQPDDESGKDPDKTTQENAAVADEYTPVAIAGANRYETAIEASKLAFPNGAETVVVTTGENWPDALGGSALAGAYGGPILLTPSAALPAAVAAEIDRLGATDAIILGGTGAVTPAVEAALADRLGADSVRRIGGANRYETAELIAREVVAKKGTDYDGTALIATGGDFPDALGGSPLAAAGPWPILLSTPTDGLTPSTAATLGDLGVTRILILGGDGVVHPTTEGALGAVLGDEQVIRLAGADRCATAVEIALWAVEDEGGFFCEGTGFATGESFPDALAGGVAQGRMRAPLLLTRSTSLPPAVADVLAGQAETMATVHYYGGPGAIAQGVRDEVGGIIE